MTDAALRRDAVLAAEVVLELLGLSRNGRVPIFDVIVDRGIWLSFEPLEGILGVYQRVGDDTSGILINSDRPRAMQRLVAAHELGHHELRHDSGADGERSISGTSDDPREIQAQLFAINLLISELSIDLWLGRRGYDFYNPRIEALDACLLSCEFGVSYEATLLQLRDLGRISEVDRGRLAKQRPLDLKRRILGGRRPENPRASVRQLTLADDGCRIVLDIEDELDLALPEVRSSGYEWALETGYETHLVVVDDRYEKPTNRSGMVFGQESTRHITLKAHRGGGSELRLSLVRPWENEEGERTLMVEVVTHCDPVSEVGRGISLDQQPQLLIR